jgi:CheY-like chemotaxis protein
MHGSIYLESEPGIGSSFTLTLPSAKPEDDAIKEITNIESPITGSPQLHPVSTGPACILMAEDNDANIELVKLYTRNTYLMEVAKNAKDALSMLQNKQYSCILMDINLGSGMDGAEAIAEIRKNSAYDNIPVIAMTVYTLKNEKEYIFSKGADYYLEKPFVKTVLTDLLDEIISK